MVYGDIGTSPLYAIREYTWNKGMEYLRDAYYSKKVDFSKIIQQLNYEVVNKSHGLTAVFITDVYDESGGSFLHYLKLNQSLPEHILIRFNLSCLDKNICQLTLCYGFMDFYIDPSSALRS